MTLYVVTNDGEYNDVYIVRANNKREAIDKVFKEYFECQNEFIKKQGYKPYTKSYFSAERLDDMFENDIACIK